MQMTGHSDTGRQLLEQSRSALRQNDRRSARRLAQMAVGADPQLREAWEIMAELSTGSARQAYLERVEQLTPVAKITKADLKSITPSSRIDHEKKEGKYF